MTRFASWAGRRSPHLLIVGVTSLIVLTLAGWRTYAKRPPYSPSREPKGAIARPDFTSFHGKHREEILADFRRSLKEDPTLAASILSITRESAMKVKHLNDVEHEAYWAHIQALQAEARKVPKESVFEAIDQP